MAIARGIFHAFWPLPLQSPGRCAFLQLCGFLQQLDEGVILAFLSRTRKCDQVFSAFLSRTRKCDQVFSAFLSRTRKCAQVFSLFTRRAVDIPELVAGD